MLKPVLLARNLIKLQTHIWFASLKHHIEIHNYNQNHCHETKQRAKWRSEARSHINKQTPQTGPRLMWPQTLIVTKDIIPLIQSILVISKSKGLSETLQDIHTSTYRFAELMKTINRTASVNKWICNFTPEVRDLLKYSGKEEKIGAISPLFHNILLPIVRFLC